MSDVSSSSIKHNGGNKIHQKFSPIPSPIVITRDSYSPSS